MENKKNYVARLLMSIGDADDLETAKEFLVKHEENWYSYLTKDQLLLSLSENEGDWFCPVTGLVGEFDYNYFQFTTSGGFDITNFPANVIAEIEEVLKSFYVVGVKYENELVTFNRYKNIGQVIANNDVRRPYSIFRKDGKTILKRSIWKEEFIAVKSFLNTSELFGLTFVPTCHDQFVIIEDSPEGLNYLGELSKEEIKQRWQIEL